MENLVKRLRKAVSDEGQKCSRLFQSDAPYIPSPSSCVGQYGYSYLLLSMIRGTIGLWRPRRLTHFGMLAR